MTGEAPQQPGWTLHPQSERDVVLEGPALQALAHPVRVEIVGILRRTGPSTASLLAHKLGLNSGATSYHLRRLAAAGLVEEDGGLGNKRDRWWKASHRSTYFDASSYDSDPEAAMAYLNAVASAYARRLIDFGNVFPTLPGAWSDSATMSDYRLRLTPQESSRLLQELALVVASYRRDDDVAEGAVPAPEGAEPVVVQLQVMPELASAESPSAVEPEPREAP
jgi:DNA-binding transcriptional ArsR family regulator